MQEHIPNGFPDFYCVCYHLQANGLKAALYACQNHTDDDIHSDHGYLETWEIPGGPPKESYFDKITFPMQ